MFISLGVVLLAVFLPASEPDPFIRALQAGEAYRAGNYAAAEAGYRSLAHDYPDAPTHERAFVYAGIMTYEKRGGRWVKVANVSTFE